jgi:hypothetical protein
MTTSSTVINPTLYSDYQYSSYLSLKPGLTKEKSVSYPQLYANFQRNSRVDGLCKAKGEIDWFLSLPDQHVTVPKIIITDGISWYLQAPNLLIRFDMAGTCIWSLEIQSQMTSCIMQGQVIHSNGPNIYHLDNNKIVQGKKFFVPYCGSRAQILFLAPIRGNGHIVQTFERGEEAKPGKKIKNLWSLTFIDNSGMDTWSKEYSQRCTPAIITKDFSNIVLPTTNGSVYFLDPITGKENSSFILKDRGIQEVSIDEKENLVIFGNLPGGAPVLLKCDKMGAIAWENRLPNVESRGFMQPPALGAAGRVFIIHADTLFCFDDKGHLEWDNGIPHDSDHEYVTILGDISLIVASSNMVKLFEPDGSTRFTLWLPVTERISTPPVIDNQGHVLIGTLKGIYRLK